MEIESGEVFEEYITPCTTYGIIYKAVMLSFYNDGREDVFPTWQRFRLLKDD
jgi:hypothetical protein